MAYVTGANKIGKDICDALGLKHCRDIKIHIPANGIVTVIAELYPEIDGAMQFPAILKRFRLEEYPKDVIETTVIGDEIKTYQVNAA